jgi:hypothetical protein
MSYAIAKAVQAELERARNDASQALSSIAGVGSSAMGLTPDSVKASPEYRAARRAYDQRHADLAAFNARFVKQYATDLAADRARRRSAQG